MDKGLTVQLGADNLGVPSPWSMVLKYKLVGVHELHLQEEVGR